MNELTLQEQVQIEVQVQLHNGVPATTSRNIAEVFGKEHYNVIRDIKVILENNPDKEFTALNFEVSEYTDVTGRKLPEYLLTRDGCMLLIMSYTGPKAMAIKTAYIKRFNEMEQLLKQRTVMPQSELDPITRERLDVYSLVLEKAGIQGNQLALALDKAVRAKTGESALKLTGVQLEAPQQEHLATPTELGKQVGASAIKINKILAEAGLQFRNTNDEWTPTKEGLDAGATLLDVGKAHSDGTPVRQLKWPYSIIEVINDYLQEHFNE